MTRPVWRYEGPRWWPWRRAVLLEPYGAIPAGYRWRVSLWPWPTPAETEAALLHDDAYLREQERRARFMQRSALRRRVVDRRLVRSLPAGGLRWTCKSWIGALVFRIGWCV